MGARARNHGNILLYYLIDLFNKLYDTEKFLISFYIMFY